MGKDLTLRTQNDGCKLAPQKGGKGVPEAPTTQNLKAITEHPDQYSYLNPAIYHVSAYFCLSSCQIYVAVNFYFQLIFVFN